MTQSQAATRARAALPHQTPRILVYQSDQPCAGLAFIRNPGAALPDLAALRDRIVALRRGTIGVGDSRRELLVVLFDGAPMAFGRDHPSALPLVASAPGILSSHGEHAADAAREEDSPVRAIDIWWAGEAQRIAFDLLEVLPLAMVWTMPRATVHAGLKLPAPVKRSETRDDGDIAQDQDAPVPGKVVRAAALFALTSERQQDPFADMRDSLGQRPSLGTTLRLGLAGALASLPAFGSLVRYALYGLFALIVLGAILRGGPVLLFVILFLIGRFIGGLLFGSRGPSDRPAPARPRGPGLFDSLLGWLAWKNPFGSMQRQIDARARQISNLAVRGMIDDALRLALRLGAGSGQGKLPRRYPRQLPSARARLDFEDTEAAFEMPILSGPGAWEMRQTYEELAKRLEREKDYRRAAFIRSQLLGQHEDAVRLLERGGLNDDAVQLALRAKVDPALTIRLLYQSGKPDAALALARRSGCFEQLVEQSRGKDAKFHGLVIKSWTDALIETGQPLRALQVTDGLAGEPGAHAILQKLRRNWLTSAMHAGEATGFAPEPMARALLSSQLGDPVQLADFPRNLPYSGDPLLDTALARLRGMLTSDDDGEDLLALLGMMHRLYVPKSEEQAGFWNGAGPALIEVLANGLLRQASHRLDRRDMDQLGQLLDHAGHRVLAHDLGKLRKLYRASPPLKRDWQVPDPVAVASPVLAACVLGTGAILAWRSSELLELRDASGAVVWRQAVSDIAALVPVGSGPNALILQREAGGLTRLTRFDSVRRALHPIGTAELLAHHDVTTELSWLVQIGGEIGALDLAALCAGSPRLEFLWSCALTDRLRAAAFLHEGTSALWVTIDVTPGRLGLTEQWRLEGSGRLNASICRIYEPSVSADPLPPILWAWGENNGHSFFQALTAKNVHMVPTAWSEEAEGDARKFLRKRSDSGAFDGFLPCDFGRSAVELADPDAPSGAMLRTTIRTLNDKVQPFSLLHNPTTALAVLARLPADHALRAPSGKQAKGQAGGKVLLADPFGQMFLVDPQSARVTVF